MWMTTAGWIWRSQTIPSLITLIETGATERLRIVVWRLDVHWPTMDMHRLPWESAWVTTIGTERLISTLLPSPTTTTHFIETKAAEISLTWLIGLDWEALLFLFWRGERGSSILTMT